MVFKFTLFGREKHAVLEVVQRKRALSTGPLGDSTEDAAATVGGPISSPPKSLEVRFPSENELKIHFSSFVTSGKFLNISEPVSSSVKWR